LNHPNIAAIHGLEESGGRKFLVMELISGETLAERIKRGSIPIDEALGIAKQIADALEAAHDSEKGIVHRDLKPANVKITPAGKVKVLDFGLAKAMESAPASVTLSDSPTLSMAATQAGVIFGTAAYMSPEQARGLNVDARSDIFSFGCVLYEMLTGRQAFQGETVADVLAGVLAREPDLGVLPASVNRRISDLLRRCLDKNPKRRWYAAADIRGEIEAILADPGGLLMRTEPALGKRPLWKRAIPVVISLALGTVIAGVALWNRRPTSVNTAVARFSFALPNDQQFTSPTRQLVSISRDGSQFVYIANDRLYLKSRNASEAIPVQGTELFPGIQNPVFSPDGRFVAFWAADRTIKRIPVSGGAAVTICEASAPFGISWGPNDEIVFGQARRIMRVLANGGSPETIVGGQGPPEVTHGPQMLPGGKAVLFTVGSTVGQVGPGFWDQAKIVVQFLDTGQRKTLIEGGSDARYVPTGHLIYVLRGDLLAVPFDISRTEVTGAPVPVVEGVRVSSVPGSSNTGTAQFDFSDEGTLVYIPRSPSAAPQRQLVFVDHNGKTKPLDLPAAAYLFPRISPDGKQLSVVTDDTKEAITWVYPLTGTTSLRRLTFGGRNDNPVWSADSQWLIIRSNREGKIGLFRQRADGTGTSEPLTERGAGAAGPVHGSGQDQIFPFTQARGGEFDVWIFSLRDKKATPFEVTPGSEKLNAVLSPDGHWLVYSSNETGRFELFVRPYPSGSAKFQITREGGAHPLWAPDGKEIYLDNNGRLYSIAIQSQPNLTWGNPVALPITGFYQQNVRPRHYDITPNGKQFVMVFPLQTITDATNSSQIQIVLNWFRELQQRVPVK